MRVLGVGDHHSLGDMYWRLTRAGHEVRVVVREPESQEIFGGINERSPSLAHGLDWVGRDGLIVCETATLGADADLWRRDGFRVVGSSAWGDQLETDRAFGQQVMAAAGMRTAPAHAFTDFAAAIAFVESHPGRYVYKSSDAHAPSTETYVGLMDSGVDLIAVLARHAERKQGPTSFVLMEHLRGVEVGIGAYFNGTQFLRPACIDWEHKRFFAGDLGELTGEMGTVVSYRHSAALFEATLARIEPLLREARHHGYININTIVNERGVFPLEFTSRFGYPGFAICDALHVNGWDDLLMKMAHGTGTQFETNDGFAVGVVLTVPPFPYEYGYAELSRGTPVFLDGVAPEDAALHWGEIEKDEGGQLRASGSIGYICVATGVGLDVPAARDSALATAQRIAIANVRYRNDIGMRLVEREWSLLQQWGWVGDRADARAP